MLPLLCALTVLTARQDQSKLIRDSLEKEASAKGLVLAPDVPPLSADEQESTWSPPRWRFLVKQEYVGAPWKVDCKLVLIPGEKERADMLRWHQLTQAGQFPMLQPALKDTGLTMFSYGCPPGQAMAKPQLPVGVYGVARHCIVSVEVSYRGLSSAVPTFTAKKLTEAMAELAANMAKEAEKVPDNALRR